LTIEQMPLPAFINTVFGDTLHVNFEIDPRIAQRNDLVTLRTGRPLPPNEILALARAILRDYGIEVVFSGNLARIIPNEALLSQSPRIVRGRGTGEIDQNMRPIFQYVPLANIAAADMAGWLQSAFGTKVRVTPAGGAVLLLGLADDIEAALQAIRTLDQPRLAGRRSIRIEPAFWTASQLAERLTDILRAEGYNASTSMQNPAVIVLLALRPSNSLVVFADDQKTLSHVEDWARDLDRASRADPQKSVYYYRVRNTTAEGVAAVLNAVLQGGAAARSAAVAPELAAPAAAGCGSRPSGRSGRRRPAARPGTGNLGKDRDRRGAQCDHLSGQRRGIRAAPPIARKPRSGGARGHHRVHRCRGDPDRQRHSRRRVDTQLGCDAKRDHPKHWNRYRHQRLHLYDPEQRGSHPRYLERAGDR